MDCISEYGLPYPCNRCRYKLKFIWRRSIYKNPVFCLEVVSALLDVTGHDQVAIIVDALTIIAMFITKYQANTTTLEVATKELVEIDEYVMA